MSFSISSSITEYTLTSMPHNSLILSHAFFLWFSFSNLLRYILS